MGYMPPDEIEKRQGVMLAMRRETVLIKVMADGPWEDDLRFIPTHNITTIEDKRIVIARRLGFDPFAEERDVVERQGQTSTVPSVSSGYRPFEKEPAVSGDQLVTMLAGLGFFYADGHWQRAERKGPMNVLHFARPVRGVPMPSMPPQVLERLKRVYSACTVWINPNTTDREGQGEITRLDDIILAAPMKQPDRSLVRSLVPTESSWELLQLPVLPEDDFEDADDE